MFGLSLDDTVLSLLSARAIPRDAANLAGGREFHAVICMADSAVSTASEAHADGVASDKPQGVLPDDKLSIDIDSNPSRPEDLQGDAPQLERPVMMPDLPDERHALRGGVSAHADMPVKPHVAAVQSVVGDRRSNAGVAATCLAPERPQVAIHDPRYAILASQWAAQGMERHPAKPNLGDVAHPAQAGVVALATGAMLPEGDVQSVGLRLQVSVPDRALHAEFAKVDLQNTPREARLEVALPVAGVVADVRRAESKISDITAKPDPGLPNKTTISRTTAQVGGAHEMQVTRVAQSVANMAQDDGVRAPLPQDIRAAQGPEIAGIAPVMVRAPVPQSDLGLVDRVRDMRMGESVPAAQVVPEHAVLRTQGPVLLQLPQRTADMLQEQVIAALHRPAPNTVQIQLDPIELGRVRISLQASESGMQVHVVTERPETLDLLRKFSADLLRDLSQMGYKELTMSFSDQRGREKPFDYSADGSEMSVSERASASDPMQIALRAEYDGVDIRV